MNPAKKRRLKGTGVFAVQTDQYVCTADCGTQQR